MKLWQLVKNGLVVLVCALLLTQSIFIPRDITDRVREYTGGIEFNYFTWTVNALLGKAAESGLDLSDAVSPETQKRIVLQYFDVVQQVETLAGKIEEIYANAAIQDPQQAAADELAQQKQLQNFLDELSPVVEEILQRQVTDVLAQNGLTIGGQATPSVLYQTTPLPKALIISPLNVIRQDANISLLANLSLDQMTQLEQTVSQKLNVSALVVDIGGVGIYPTMVMQSSDPVWVIDTIAHEWTHNFLTLRPLGLNYDTNNQLRTMNETTAEIVGGEISKQVIALYYPELQGSSSLPEANSSLTADGSSSAPTFDFNTEMHTTRVKVDELLKEGKITEAEQYMEQRRQVFVAHGYMIRKLNQAYFAFYGAYAETPVGAAGADPVGPAVRALRAQSKTLADFLNRISWMTSFTELQQSVQVSR